MKTIIFVLIIQFLSTVSFADIEVIKSPLYGKAINGPDNTIQIFNPKFDYAGDNRYRHIKSDTDTATSICKILGKEYYGHRGEIFSHSINTVDIVSFDKIGLFQLILLRKNETIEILSILACK